MSMDLKRLDTARVAEEGYELQLRDPVSREPLEGWITVRGADSKTYRDAVTDMRRRRLRELQRNRGGPAEPDQADNDAMDLLVACTLRWREITEDGVPVAFSESNVRDIYTRYPTIREQVDAAIHDRANFLPKSAPLS